MVRVYWWGRVRGGGEGDTYRDGGVALEAHGGVGRVLQEVHVVITLDDVHLA
jgi:hypothetical protein